MIRGLLFDLDGVLVNTNPLHYQAWKELAEELGIPFTPKDLNFDYRRMSVCNI